MRKEEEFIVFPPLTVLYTTRHRLLMSHNITKFEND